MDQARVRRQPAAAPWSGRVLEAAPLPSVWVGVAVAALLLGAFFGFELASGRLAVWLAEDDTGRVARGISVLLVLLAYVPTAQLYLARWTRATLEALRPALRRDVEYENVYRRRSSRLVGVAGAALFTVLFLLEPGGLGDYVRRDYWTVENALPWLVLPVFGWLTTRFGYAVVFDARFVSRLAGELRRIDLFDMQPLAPFAQQGLRGALLVLLFVGVGAAGLVGQTAVLGTALLTAVALLAIGIAALLLPVTGLRARLRAEKLGQLRALRAGLDADRADVLARAAGADAAAARLPGLLALEARIEAVREWPFDLPSLLRFALYVALGLGSWLGAAGVERLLDLALD
jgi:hypothetical protein